MKNTTLGTRIFLASYGSLKRGFHNHRFIGRDVEPIAKSTVSGYMYMAFGYPYLFKNAPNENAVSNAHEIEIFEITPQQEEIIDGLESAEYIKDYIEVEINGKTEKTIIYWTQPERAGASVRMPAIKAYDKNTLKELGYLN